MTTLSLTRPAASHPTGAVAAALTAAGFKGDVDTDGAARAAMSTDNSVYRITPDLIVAPTDADDVTKLLRVLNQPAFLDLPVTARGGGTGTNGQSLNTGVIVDFRRHMNRILALNIEEGWVDVEPGIVLDELNTAIAKTGLFFAPNTSTASRCTIGGMVSTDASGKGSRKFGKTSDNVMGLEVVLFDGKKLNSLQPSPPWAAPMLAAAESASRAGRAALLSHAPKLSRRFTGYDLERAVGETGFEWWRLFLGAESTLGLVTRARLRLLPRPTTQRLVVLAYERFADALAAGPSILTHDPTAIEVMDTLVCRLAAEAGLTQSLPPAVREVDGKPVAYSFVEFSGVNAAGVDAAVAGLLHDIAQHRGLVGHHVAAGTAELAQLWAVRSASVGLLSRSHGGRRPIAFVEDSVVPLDHLESFVAEFDQLMVRSGLSYGIYGHIDVGCLHVRPALDIDSVADRRLLLAISDAVFELTRKHGGIFWGEHGKGVRGAYLRQFVGDTAYAAFEKIKLAFDPNGRFNPGKLVSPRTTVFTVDGTPFRTMRAPADSPLQAVFDCNGNAECMSFARSEVMCPSFKVTRDPRQSPKGRAEALRAWEEDRAGRGASHAEITDATFEALDTCLGCKACSSKCPTHVDIPRVKSIFLETYYQDRARPLTDLATAALERHALLLDSLRPAVRVASKIALPLAERLLGFTGLPRFSARSTARLWPTVSHHRAASTRWPKSTVFLVGDAFTGLFDVNAQLDVARGLSALGYSPVFVRVPGGAKAAYNLGMRANFRHAATAQVAALAKLDRAERPIVGIDPSFVLMLRHEYAELNTPVPQVLLVQEFLHSELNKPRAWPRFAQPDGRVSIFLHCTEASTSPSAGRQWREVFDALGIQVTIESAGCCGMAGMFGHLQRHQTVSQRLFDANWRPITERLGTTWASGFSCRTQIERLAHQVVRHPLGLLVG